MYKLFLFGCAITSILIVKNYTKIKDFLICKSNKLKIFNMNNIEIGDNIFIIGKRSSGKSTLVSKILSYKENIGIEMIFSPTEILERFYVNKISKNVQIFPSYKSNILYNFIRQQKDNINSHIIEDNSSIIILDNCLLRPEYNDYNLTDLLVNGFFYKTINLITSAYPAGFGKYFKSNIDYLFMLKETHLLYKNEIYEDYFKSIIDYDTYINLIDKYTNNYSSIVLDLKNGGILYYYK